MADPLLICTCGFLLIYFVFLGLSNRLVVQWNEKYKTIKREWRMLEAVLKDYNEVSQSAAQITQKANQLFDSELIHAGWTVQLDALPWWIKTAEESVCILERFKKLRNTRKSPTWFVLFFVRAFNMHFDLDLMESYNKKLKRKPCANVYKSLEQARSMVICLQHRSVVPISKPPPVGLTSADHKLISSFLINKPDFQMDVTAQKLIESFLMDLQLLHEFMKDIERIKEMGTNMEMSWVKVAKKTIDKAKAAISAIAMGRQSLQKVKKEIVRFDTGISELLESKESYGFKFIRRESSKSAARHRCDDVDYLSALCNIQKLLNALPLPETSSKLSLVVGSLRKELESTRKHLEETKATEHASDARHACLEQLKKLATEAEKYSEEDSDQSLSEFVKQLIKDVSGLKRRMKVYSIEVGKELCSAIGLDEDIHELVRRLTTTNTQSSDQHNNSVISIMGMKGIGKTTLAMKVYSHGTIANYFQIRKWVSIPKWSNKKALLKSVGSKVLTELSLRQVQQISEKKEWPEKIFDLLKKKRCLIVLDNVLSRASLEALISAFSKADMTNGSRIVITICSKAFADHSQAHDDCPNSVIQCYPLRLRTQEESWEFFTQMVHIPSSDKKLICEAKKLVGETGGLPLVIFRLGYLLSCNKEVTSKELSRLLERITYGRNQSPWLDTKDMNKEDLKKCYFELFPGRDFEIPARRLVALWVAKQLFPDRHGAYKHLLELIGRNIIQVVQRKPNGDVKTCCLPSSLRELLLRDKGISSTAHSWSLSTSCDHQHISYHFDDNDASFSRINGLNTNSSDVVLQGGNYPRSILFFDTREGNKPGEEIGVYLRSGIERGFFRQLIFLDLERVFRPKLPDNIGKLKLLTYLGLRWTYLKEIPDHVGNLESLETLDLKHTDVYTLPSSIWKLKKLRHLYLNRTCSIKFPHQSSTISARNVHTLSGVFVDKASLVKDRLEKLTALRKLVLAFQLGDAEQNVLVKWIDQLAKLKSLKLAAIDEKSVTPLLKLKPLSKLEQLCSLYLIGKLEKPEPFIVGLPESLMHITLSGTEIKQVAMEVLGKLPKLKSLSLITDSYRGTAMVCSKDEFPQLFVLKLWNLEFLEELNVKEGAMRTLREIEVRSCIKLATTKGLTQLKILQEIKLTNMPKKCTDDIENVFAAAVAQSKGETHTPAIKIEHETHVTCLRMT